MTEPDSTNTVFFSHGKESGPWGGKIQAMARVAEGAGCRVLSIDYQGMESPADRVDKLIDSIRQTHTHGKLILVGSSMGSYVSIAASQTVKPDGLFLLAPAVCMPGYPESNPTPVARKTLVIHGWSDEIVPVESAIYYCRQHNLESVFVNDSHRLLDSVPRIEQLLSLFLREVLASSG
ncbi:MAG: alpha/beta hydrolase [Gammaproteobacteria bacterium]|nr:MAG: alpha/beta hydrolase [Pseudomonadota bacterium]PIE38337.1 MAG: alpha/beta hydrolase [Gammaproteobacteria bacterium]